MERRIFKFGSSSVALIVPKKWLCKSGLKPSSSVYLSESERGDLIISPNETVHQDAEEVVNLKTKPVFLSRWIGLHYMYGVSKLRVYSAEGFTKAQIESIENKINAECPGFEITCQSNKDIVIEDLTNIKEIDLERIISRLRSLINQEFIEIKEGDPKTVVKIEKLVNRFYMLGIRYVNITQIKDALMYFGILNFLESISDKLDTLTSDFDLDKKQIFEDLSLQFELSFPAMKGDAKLIERVAEMRERVSNKLARSKSEKIYLKLIQEISDDISGIAEFGLRAENNITFVSF